MKTKTQTTKHTNHTKQHEKMQSPRESNGDMLNVECIALAYARAFAPWMTDSSPEPDRYSQIKIDDLQSL